MNDEAPETIFQRAAERAKQMGLPYAGAVTPAEAHALHLRLTAQGPWEPAHLLAIARMERPTETDRGEGWIGDYELEIRAPGKEHEDPKFTLRWQSR